MPEFDLNFTILLVASGLMIGLMYALIALGFVLVYKATDAINFAQGEFVMFAGFIAAGAADLAGAPFWVSALLAIAGMVLLGFGLERITLALFKHHGFAVERWPLSVRDVLGL